VDDVLDELQEIHESEIYIVDDDFLISPDRITEFLDGLEERGINKHYLVYARSDFIVSHKELVTRFKKLGLKTVIVGFESFDEEELKKYNKANSVKVNEECMKFLNEINVDCYATVILNPEWDFSNFRFLESKLKELNIKYVNLQPLTPLPGTDFKIDESKVCLDRKEYEKWDLAHVSVRPTKMSIPQFYKQIMRMYGKIVYRPGVIFSYFKYPPLKLWRMLKGAYMVNYQYRQKYKEALGDA